MITTAFIANLAGNHHSIVLGLVGLALSHLCLSWEKWTTQWWAILFEGFKQIEALAVSEGTMVSVYQRYPRKPLRLFVRATHAIECIY